jgi:hypothetical protein
MEQAADIATLVRDILISVYLLAGVLITLVLGVMAFLLFKGVLGLTHKAGETLENVNKVSEAAVEHIVEPLSEGVSFSSTVGNAVGFASGFVSGFMGKRSGKDRDRKKKR